MLHTSLFYWENERKEKKKLLTLEIKYWIVKMKANVDYEKQILILNYEFELETFYDSNILRLVTSNCFASAGIIISRQFYHSH